jgi:hypothetical protein
MIGALFFKVPQLFFQLLSPDGSQLTRYQMKSQLFTPTGLYP